MVTDTIKKKYFIEPDFELVKVGREVNGEANTWWENETHQAHRCMSISDINIIKSEEIVKDLGYPLAA